MKTHAKTRRRKESAATATVLCGFAPLREPNTGSRELAGGAPTFALLREKRRLRVRNPENGVCFTISLRDWREAIWAVRMHPAKRSPLHARNPFCQTHRLMPRTRIEEWLAELQHA